MENLQRFQDFSNQLLRRFQEERWIDRLWAKDSTLWSSKETVRSSILNRLGWLDSPVWITENLERIKSAFAPLRSRFQDCVVLGMGGSSLCTEVFSSVFEKPKCHILDSTDPDAIRALEQSISIDKTLFIVSSKSGTTVEVEAFFRYFSSRAPKDAFLCITDPGTPLAERFENPWINPPDIGGRFSALSYFGLLPLAWMDGPLSELLQSALAMRQACQSDSYEKNPGARLGLFMASAALAGRNKLTLISSPRFRAFGAWMEQLVAESTGKMGVGILPVLDSHLDGYAGNDRAFVFVDQQPPEGLSEKHPVHTLSLSSLEDLGGEFFRWEVATSLAAVALGINPFDEPDVNESKARTRNDLDQGGTLDQKIDRLRSISTTPEALKDYFSNPTQGGFGGLLVYAPFSLSLDQALRSWMERQSRAHGIPFTLGYGPRFLHSTGQWHKGGPNQGKFLQVTCANEELSIPGWSFGFCSLKLAQAMGDFQVLKDRGREIRHLFFDRPESVETYFRNS